MSARSVRTRQPSTLYPESDYNLGLAEDHPSFKPVANLTHPKSQSTGSFELNLDGEKPSQRAKIISTQMLELQKLARANYTRYEFTPAQRQAILNYLNKKKLYTRLNKSNINIEDLLSRAILDALVSMVEYCNRESVSVSSAEFLEKIFISKYGLEDLQLNPMHLKTKYKYLHDEGIVRTFLQKVEEIRSTPLTEVEEMDVDRTDFFEPTEDTTDLNQTTLAMRQAEKNFAVFLENMKGSAIVSDNPKCLPPITDHGNFENLVSFLPPN